MLPINKKTLTISITLGVLLIGASMIQVYAAANDSSITLKKDSLTGSFILTIKDPDGIQEFSMTPTGKLAYGGQLSNCPRTFINNAVSFEDPADFQPMKAYIIDCQNNTTNLEIAPPKDGLARSKAITIVEETKEVLAPSRAQEVKKEETKKGSLSAANISYPVPELGDCKNEAECRSYCDNSQRAKECFAFAKKYNLITEKEAKEAQDKFLSVTNGPGSCNSGSSCEAYCNTIDHIDECIAFAEKSGYYDESKLAEAKKIQELAKSGKQFPGGCKNRNSCEVYCNDPNHMDECLNFAEAAGFMPKEEIDQARKILPLMKEGKTPGGCTSKEKCESYCSEEGHNDECIAFGEKAGLISPEDADMIKKTGGKGPGGCHSKQQCETYCENNSDECFAWAKDKGLVSENDLSKMKEGMSQFKDQLDKMPPEVVTCLKSAVGEKNFDKMVNGEPIFDRSMEGKMKSCFNQITTQVSKQLDTLPPEAAQCIKDTVGEEGLQKLKKGELSENTNFSSLEGCFQKLQESFGGQEGPGRGPGGPGGFSGPGGCKSIDECTAICTKDPEACKDFAPHEGSTKSGGIGCGIVDGTRAAFVCGINGKDALPGTEITYFNECHAKGHDNPQILHEGPCKGHNPCSDVAHPVCGSDGASYVHECYAKEHGVEIKHEGACTNEDRGLRDASDEQHSNEKNREEFQKRPSEFPAGPGGCKSQEECMAYCKEHYTDSACGGSGRMPPSSDNSGVDYQKQYQEQYQKQLNGFVPPTGSTMPPAGMMPPAGFQPPTGSFGPPPGF